MTSITQLPVGSTVGITIAMLLVFCCWNWQCGPLYVLQVWLVNLRAFLQWLMHEAIGGVQSRWPRFGEIRERIQRGEKSGRQQTPVTEPDSQSETV